MALGGGGCARVRVCVNNQFQTQVQMGFELLDVHLIKMSLSITPLLYNTRPDLGMFSHEVYSVFSPPNKTL